MSWTTEYCECYEPKPNLDGVCMKCKKKVKIKYRIVEKVKEARTKA